MTIKTKQQILVNQCHEQSMFAFNNIRKTLAEIGIDGGRAATSNNRDHMF